MLGLGLKLSLATTKVASSTSAFADDYSVELDGTNDYLGNTSFDRDAIKSEVSVSSWVKLDAASGNDVAVGAQDDAATFVLRAVAGKMEFRIRHSNNAARFFRDTSSISGAGWKHIVGTFKRDGEVKLYVDGSLIGSASVSNLDLQITDSDTDNNGTLQTGVALGVNSPTSIINPFDGNLNDAAIWSVELDADAVTAIYNSGVPLDLTVDIGDYDNSASLVGYWKMEENTGTTVEDSSSNSNTMTLTNGAAFSSDTP